MDLLIDFETRSKCDLRACGGYVYSTHPSTTILCLGYSYGNDHSVWVPDHPLPAKLRDYIEDCDKVVAHNYLFEYWIWENIGRKKFDFPAIPFEKWDCTMARALATALPRSVEKCAVALGLPFEKDMKGNRVMLKMSKPRKPTKHDKREWFDDPADFQTVYDYCAQDIKVQKAIHEKLYSLSTFEKEVWRLDFKINNRGIPLDGGAILRAKGFCAQYVSEESEDLSRLTDGLVSSAGQVKVILNFCRFNGVDIGSLARAELDRVLKTELPNDVRRILEIRRNLSKASVKKLDSMLAQMGEDDRVRGGLVYHAATTGRWGGKGIQIQNFPRPVIDNPEECVDDLVNCDYDTFKSKYPSVLDAVSSCLRYFITAPAGKEFIISDFSAIEARMVFWLAESALGIQQFKQGRDIYKEMASTILNVPVDKITKDQRQLGKQAILGCGYGMGAAKFKVTCDGYGMDVNETLAEMAVKTYRSKYEDIPKFWYGVEDAAVKAVRTAQVTSYKKIKFGVRGDYLFCQLPSGRKLSYYRPKLIKTVTPWGAEKDQLTFMGVNSMTKKWERQTTYGGKLVENITQAVARDAMVNSMLNVERAGIDIIFTVHDELVCEIDKGSWEIEDFDKLMTARPSWGLDIPIAVESELSRRYKK